MSWHDALSKKYLKKPLYDKTDKINKYNAIRTANGFPSQLEEAVYNELKNQESFGALKDIERQATVHYTTRVKWKVDFKVFDLINNEPVWIEAKGIETDRYKVMRNLWYDFGPGLLRIYKGKKHNIYLFEEIRGKGE